MSTDTTPPEGRGLAHPLMIIAAIVVTTGLVMAAI